MCGRTGGRDISQKEEKVSQLTELFWFSITATAEQHNAALEAISGRTSSSSSSSHRIDYPFLQNGANRSICACILIQAGRLASTGGTRMEFDMMNDGASTSRTPQSNKYIGSLQVPLLLRESLIFLFINVLSACTVSQVAYTVSHLWNPEASICKYKRRNV